MTNADAHTTTEDVPDEIHRSIRIDADAATVWGIVSEPGWFINDGTWTVHEVTTDGDISRVVDPVHGEFSLRTVELDPPRRAVFHWLGGRAGNIEAGELSANTIEFLIEPEGAGVVLTVRESGFAGMDDDDMVRRRRFEENSAGWETELAVARDRAGAAA